VTVIACHPFRSAYCAVKLLHGHPKRWPWHTKSWGGGNGDSGTQDIYLDSNYINLFDPVWNPDLT